MECGPITIVTGSPCFVTGTHDVETRDHLNVAEALVLQLLLDLRRHRLTSRSLISHGLIALHLAWSLRKRRGGDKRQGQRRNCHYSFYRHYSHSRFETAERPAAARRTMGGDHVPETRGDANRRTPHVTAVDVDLFNWPLGRDTNDAKILRLPIGRTIFVRSSITAD
jgi:hypothetical protein